MLILLLNLNEVLVYLRPQVEYLLHINVPLEYLLPELSSLYTRLLNHLLKPYIDLLKLYNLLDLRLHLEVGNVEFQALLRLGLILFLLQLHWLVTHALGSSRLEVGDDLTGQDEALVLVLERALDGLGEA